MLAENSQTHKIVEASFNLIEIIRKKYTYTYRDQDTQGKLNLKGYCSQQKYPG
jgi:hypothetical protein